MAQLETAPAVAGRSFILPPRSGRTLLLTAWTLGTLVVVTAVFAAIARGLKMTFYFQEWRPVTLFSAAQILAVAGLSGLVAARRRRKLPESRGAWLWAFVALGFVFLACDEVFEIHENLDKALHRLLRIRETVLSDRLDDAVLAGYGLAGVAVLYACRAELRVFRAALPLLRLGVVLFFLNVAVDALTDSWGIPASRFPRPAAARSAGSLFHVLEDALKIYAEGALLSAFIVMARRGPDRS